MGKTEQSIQDFDVLNRPFTILMSHDSETKSWTAHCLDFDIVEEGKTQEKSLIHLFKIMRSNVRDAIKHNTLKDLFHFAPPEYWVQALAARSVSLEGIMEQVRLSSFHIRLSKLDLKLITCRA